MLSEQSILRPQSAEELSLQTRSLRVVAAHNHYQQAGGEDQVFSSEINLLREKGHQVIEYAVRNDDVGKIGKLSLARYASWNPASYRDLLELFQSTRPDIVHVHNTLPLISPAIYYAATAAGAAVVQTLHNFRIFCPGAFLHRKGTVCEKCLGRTFALPGILHGCYRGSRLATAASAASSGIHRLSGTYRKKINRYIALTEFGAKKAEEGGLPAAKIRVKPNFPASDPGVGSGNGGYALFVGRLSAEKGIATLLSAFEADAGIALKVIGSGPEEAKVRDAAVKNSQITWLGRLPHAEVIRHMREAAFLVFPSEWYEGFPMSIVEAFACGLPVIASNLGSMSTIVRAGENGLHFEAGNAEGLRRQIHWAVTHPAEMSDLRLRARRDFERKYTADKNYELLTGIYREAVREVRLRQQSENLFT